MRKFKYTGDGAGVPGLPHEISELEIDQLTEEQYREFTEALSTGVYIETEPIKTDFDPSEGE